MIVPAPVKRVPARARVGLALAAILLVGGALRAEVAAHPGGGPRSGDERSYTALAFSLARGTYGDRESGLRQPLHWPPGAPALFSAAARVDPGDAGLRLAYWLQALVGTALIAVCFAIAALAAGPVAGLVAAALVAVYPPLVTVTGALLSEPLGALLLASGVLALTWALRDGRLRFFALAGVLFAGTVLTRTDQLPAPPLVAAVVVLALWRTAGPRPAAAAGGALLVGFALALAPWVAYTSSRTGHLVAVTEGDGAALFVGTYLPGDGTTLGMKRHLGDAVRARFPSQRGRPDGRIEGPLVLALVAERRPGLPMSRALRAEAGENLRRYALRRPGAFAGMMLAKARRTWWVSSRAGSPHAQRATRVYHAVLVTACLALVLAGLALRRVPLLGVVAALVLASMLVHAVFVAKPRYALPVVPLLIVGGVVAAATLRTRPQPPTVRS